MSFAADDARLARAQGYEPTRWTCEVCGVTVPIAEPHDCPEAAKYRPATEWAVRQRAERLDRLERALKAGAVGDWRPVHGRPHDTRTAWDHEL